MSVATAVRLGPLSPGCRVDLESIVRSTSVFSDEEVGVALELFDSGDPDYEFVGAFEADRLVGYACFGPTPATDSTFDLYWIAVHADAQRTGAGSALMSEVEQRLAGRGARTLVVETSSRAEYEATRRFYARRGYEQSAIVRDFYARGDHRVILTKHLASAVGRQTPA